MKRFSTRDLNENIEIQAHCLIEQTYRNVENDVLVYYYNFAWKDYGDASLSSLLNMVKVLAFAVSEGRVAVHCHAGELKNFNRDNIECL